LRGRLSDHAAPQQEDGFTMVARWDAILLATAVAGGSMLIENSHRLDTGAPDEEVVAMSACDTVIAVRIWKQAEDAGNDTDAAQAPSGCLSE
jgi:hypothetical protein